MKFTGKIKQHLGTKTGSGNNGDWANASFLVEETNPHNEDYPQMVVFKYFKSGEYAKYAANFEQQFKEGTVVDVEFNLKANEYKGNWYNNLDAWKVEKVGDGKEEAVGEDLPF
jgi:hypothetical protein